MRRTDLAARLDARARGQPHVHDDDVGPLGVDDAQRLVRIARLADDLQAGHVLEKAAQPAAHQFVVVAEDDPHRPTPGIRP